MRLLFVCSGNICRSPTAEGVFRARVAAARPRLAGEWIADSAGTHGFHAGDPPDPRACRAALARGYDLSGLRARQVNRADFARHDLILAMDRGHRAFLQRMAPGRGNGPARRKIALFLDHAPETGWLDVPDPYCGDDRDFERVLDLIETGVDGLIAELTAKRAAAS